MPSGDFFCPVHGPDRCTCLDHQQNQPVRTFCSVPGCRHFSEPGSTLCRHHDPNYGRRVHGVTEAEFVAYLNQTYGTDFDHLPTLEELRATSKPTTPDDAAD